MGPRSLSKLPLTATNNQWCNWRRCRGGRLGRGVWRDGGQISPWQLRSSDVGLFL